MIKLLMFVLVICMIPLAVLKHAFDVAFKFAELWIGSEFNND